MCFDTCFVLPLIVTFAREGVAKPQRPDRCLLCCKWTQNKTKQSIDCNRGRGEFCAIHCFTPPASENSPQIVQENQENLIQSVQKSKWKSDWLEAPSKESSADTCLCDWVEKKSLMKRLFLRTRPEHGSCHSSTTIGSLLKPAPKAKMSPDRTLRKLCSLDPSGRF